jgi:dynamin-like GTPase MGM1, mitochondrial
VRLGRGLSKEEVERFAREDPRVRGHLEVIRRKELLELVLGKMEGLRDLNVEERGRRKLDKGKERKSGWSLF